MEACREAVKAKPDSAIAHNDLGWALRQNNNAKEAEVELRAAVTLDDKLHQAHSNLSVCLLEAVEEARKAVGLKQDQPIYHVVLGNALSASGDNKGAVEEYKLAIEQKPDYENAYYNLGRVLDIMGDANEAGKALSQALRLDPDDERVLKILDRIVK